MKKNIYIIISLVTAVTVIGITSCTKIDETKPDYIFTEEDAIQSPADVQNLLNSCYDAFANAINGRMQTYNDLLSDDLTKPIKDDNGFKNEIYNRNTNIFNSDVKDLYKTFYVIPFRINNMESFYTKVGVSESEQKRMRAEGRFLRAACHFEVLKLWAQPSGFSPSNDHPGIVIRDEVSQLPKTRSTVAESYAFIISDLQYAIENLPEPNDDYKASKSSAKALLAKVYYMMNKPTEALVLLNDVIASSGKSLSGAINRFDTTAALSEFIFTTRSTGASDNRAGEFVSRYRCDTKTAEFALSKELYTLLTADTLDKRGKNLVQIFNAGKDNEYYGCKKFNSDFFGVPYLNMTDLVLTRAELAAETGDLATAIGDINKIIYRAYADSTTKILAGGANASDVLAEIRKQRRLELFCEGDRVQSLKRRGANNTDPSYNSNLKIRNASWYCPGLTLQFPSVETGAGFVFNGTGGCN
ncbi:MAG: RagB/SusD family nutrient uptake outer membrane protein [Bacteroidota bacterium]